MDYWMFWSTDYTRLLYNEQFTIVRCYEASSQVTGWFSDILHSYIIWGTVDAK